VSRNADESALPVEPAIASDLDSLGDARGNVTLRLTGISKNYSGVAALSDVGVEFCEGEVHAVLGENGAGKSTLMSIISGVTQPDAGEIHFEGRGVSPMSPETAAALGIAISYQHPAILDDLSVLDNLQVALPQSLFAGGSPRNVAEEVLKPVGLNVPLRTRADSLTVAEKQLLEIAKALAMRPKVLILDEPTASLDRESTDMLFDRIRAVVQDGASVIYITHRLAEVRQIASRVTVLRDGCVRGRALVSEVTDEALLSMIVGRALGSTFPPKTEDSLRDVNFSVEALDGQRFRNVSFDVKHGQILGVAGVAGNGQSELMRALAGLEPSDGAVRLGGRALSHQDLLREAAFMPSDRLVEGLAGGLTIRENASMSALGRFASFGIVRRNREVDHVRDAFRSLAVKATSLEAPVRSLSGGNQQKVVMARALLAEPGLIVADEPTQGVDVGARAEIYRILREITNRGTPVVVNSSDAAELEGLCDKVVVLSRGRVVETLTGSDVVEAGIVAAAVSAQHHLDAEEGGAPQDGGARRSDWRHFLQTDNAPAVPLAIATVLLALFAFYHNPNFLSAFNVSNILMLATALGFIALGQTIPLLLAGVDLSVGPLAGLLVVIASFFVNDDRPTMVILAGLALIFAGAVVVGAINGCLIRFANFTPIAATLAMYIGLQGCSFLLRDGPGGYINASVTQAITWELGPIPVAFLALAACVVLGEYVLRKTRAGWQLRAVGSDEESARRIGLRIDRVVVLGYIACSLFAALGAVMLMAQIGVGDPQQGVNYTLSSITAVVLGGTSLRGARGSFIGTAIGALLLTEVLNVVAFLGLSQTYQYVFQGALILVAALVYSAVRGRAGG
jgi:ribose transport system ATP-binding protein